MIKILFFLGLLACSYSFEVLSEARRSKGIVAHIKVYSGINLKGDYRNIYTDEQRLDILNFDNRIQSANILSGIWILYEHEYYNSIGLRGRVAFFWGSNYKVKDFTDSNDLFSSIRYSGDSKSMSYNTISFYEGFGFMGAEQYFNKDESTVNYQNFGQSVIMTGCKPWTLYDEEFFRGDRVCLYPESSKDCEPSFFPRPSDFGGFSNKVGSVRLGCFSHDIYYGQRVSPNSTTIINDLI